MPEIADKILMGPSRPSAAVEPILRELGKYGSLSEAPSALLTRLQESLTPNQALVLWALDYGSGRRPIYSIEDREASLTTLSDHRRDYRAHNPKLMKVYSLDLKNYQ